MAEFPFKPKKFLTKLHIELKKLTLNFVYFYNYNMALLIQISI